MEAITINKRHARRLILSHQGLWPPRQVSGKESVIAIIRRLGCIQYDPLDIVGRNPELVLQSRVEGFRPRLLDELLYQDRLLLDGWDKNMAIYLLEDWPNFRRRRQAVKAYQGRSREAVEAVLPEVRREMRERGPLSSLDLHIHQKVDWSWAPARLARAALESLYFWGELIIHHRVNSRRFYDFAHRHLPADLLMAADPHQTEEDYADWFVKRRLGSVGLLWNRSGDAWLGVPFKVRQRAAALERLTARGEVLPVRVEGIEPLLYMRRSELIVLEETRKADRRPLRTSILAPLDNFLWDRKLVKALFGFDYIWEVYKPVSERRFGYYVLPVLYGDRFIGRVEPVRDKENGGLLIKNWWWEAGIKPSKRMKAALQRCFRQFLAFLGATGVRLDGSLAKRPDLDWLADLRGD